MNTLQHLQGKKILFFSVQTFGLEKDIVHQLEKHGAEVTYFDERPSNSTLTKGLIRLKKNLLQKNIDKYYQDILEKIQNIQFDYLLVNRGEVVTPYFMQEFIKQQPNCERIFYTWDSFKNHAYGLDLLSFFHKKFTFDKSEAIQYKIGFRPLYFTDRYRGVNNADIKQTIDLLFLGTAHSDRYIISSKIAEWCESNNLIAFNYYYMQGRFVYFFKKFFDNTFKVFDYKKLSFMSLSPEQIVEYYKQSKVILDINHPGQTGLTMRTFESIGAGKKLVTTNQYIKDYPFYNENNILIIDRANPILSRDFFEQRYVELDEELYERCSIDGWIDDLFFGEEENFWL